MLASGAAACTSQPLPSDGVAESAGGSATTGGAGATEPERTPALALNSLVEQNGTFVSVGSDGTTWRGPDGSYNGGGSEEFEAIYASRDGTAWERVHEGPMGFFSRVVAGNGSFLALGWDGEHPYTSEDGYTWTPQPRGLTDVSDVVFGNGLFVATDSDDARFYTSRDAKAWESVDGPPGPAFFQAFEHIAYGNGHFVATRELEIYTSDDAVNWSIANYDGLSIVDLHWAADRFVVKAMEQVDEDRFEYGLATSSDGRTWEQHELIDPETFPVWSGPSGCVALRVEQFDGGGLVSGATCAVAATPLGSELAFRQSPDVLVSLAGAGYESLVLMSTDGLSWKTVLSAR